MRLPSGKVYWGDLRVPVPFPTDGHSYLQESRGLPQGDGLAWRSQWMNQSAHLPAKLDPGRMKAQWKCVFCGVTTIAGWWWSQFLFHFKEEFPCSKNTVRKVRFIESEKSPATAGVYKEELTNKLASTGFLIHKVAFSYWPPSKKSDLDLTNQGRNRIMTN